ALRLLYETDKSALLISALTGVVESLVYPLLLLTIWKGFSLVAGQGSGHQHLGQGAILLGALFVLLATQHVLRIVNETATSLLQAESAQHVNARIMGKMAQVPYRLFEDNEFQSRYGLLISQASYRPSQLVHEFIGSLSALISALAVAVTLLALAPLLALFLLVLIPLTMVEARFHQRTLDLQTDSASDLFRLMYLSQRSIDATWQRDIRVHRSTILDDEYRMIAHRYLGNLRRLLRRFQVIRVGVGVGAAALVTLATGTVFLRISQGPSGLAEAAILLPALYLGLTQGRAFSASWGSLMECVGYIARVLEFLNHPFEQTERIASMPAPPIPARQATAIGA
ncbi:MAG: hypothetical protein ACRDG4_01705, partial [Chloroflexota bacterium]